jgi:hypothetical protein
MCLVSTSRGADLGWRVQSAMVMRSRLLMRPLLLCLTGAENKSAFTRQGRKRQRASVVPPFLPTQEGHSAGHASCPRSGNGKRSRPSLLEPQPFSVGNSGGIFSLHLHVRLSPTADSLNEQCTPTRLHQGLYRIDNFILSQKRGAVKSISCYTALSGLVCSWWESNSYR